MKQPLFCVCHFSAKNAESKSSGFLFIRFLHFSDKKYIFERKDKSFPFYKKEETSYFFRNLLNLITQIYLLLERKLSVFIDLFYVKSTVADNYIGT